MKVERARSEKPEAERSDANARNIRLQTSSNAAAVKTAGTSNQGAFSRFLESARQPSDNNPTDKTDVDSANDSSAEKTSKNGKDDAVQAKNGRDDNQKNFSGDSDGHDGSAWAPAPVPIGETTAEKSVAPQARSILHIADLERIVSAVRSDSFAGTKEVTIDLKNSVLEGLQIKLTLTEQGNLKAELLAQNEQIKKQLEARKRDLESVLKDRSIKIHELNVAIAAPRVENATVAPSDAA